MSNKEEAISLKVASGEDREKKMAKIAGMSYEANLVNKDGLRIYGKQALYGAIGYTNAFRALKAINLSLLATLIKSEKLWRGSEPPSKSRI